MPEFLAPLASLLGIEVGALLDRIKKNAIAWSLIGALGLVAVVFLLVAANAGLTVWVGPVIAPVIIALVALVIALIVYASLSLSRHAEQRRVADLRETTQNTALVSTAVAALPAVLNSNVLRKAALPVGAGLAVYWLFSRRRGRPPRDY